MLLSGAEYYCTVGPSITHPVPMSTLQYSLSRLAGGHVIIVTSELPRRGQRVFSDAYPGEMSPGLTC